MKINPVIAEKYPSLKQCVDLYNDRVEKTHYWENSVVSNMTIVDAKPNQLIWEFYVEQRHCHIFDRVHGGCAATVIDIASSFAVLVHEGELQWRSIGVSTDLSVSYLSSIPKGITARVECDLLRLGNKLGSVVVRVYDDQQKMCYSALHTKFNVDSRL
ncbi:HotDog domain-containing protein [Phycomyces blakesleeanus]|uniref:Thioesterase domain-containing protein n=2 Tax=Phycomyces blakesleeanus TaxID=4837 RepID=A0A162V043_PHYB8|nr:hypothetical protein PHYBLDRAFT_184653 [Phycomyces blakesleeanus NRRL 1555(-)]OAD79113.1 hypothetical protein PHYBLDRAFT_184653 [Phycomyces blakesleeanus NRRL 1555(-)]|eukprot:XP_018297153.1 hypothetical protein PHYBLDRAFT_184653 [Phycomyces blakesleeanus NRRL 1555(-)]